MSNATERALLVLVLLPFTALTAAGFWLDGFAAIQAAITFNLMSLQIYFDLVIAILIICVWMYRDARATGRNPWPWLVAAVIVGSFSPLFYLLTHKSR